MRNFTHNTIMFERSTVQTLKTRIAEPVRNIQIVSGPRRVGKTVAVQASLNNRILESADAPGEGGTGAMKLSPRTIWCIVLTIGTFANCCSGKP